MLVNPVASDDLAARWRPLTDSEADIVPALLDDAWAVLLTLAPTVADVAEDSPLSAVVAAILCAAVKRVLLNPGGNKTESIDDYSFTRDDSTATGGLYFTDAELELVRGVKPKAKSVRYVTATDWSG